MRFPCAGIKQNNMLILLVLVKRGLKIHSDALQLQDFPGKCGHWSQSWIPTESKLFLRKRKKLNFMAAKTACPSSNWVQNDVTLASWICRERAPALVLLLHPSAASQHWLMEITKISTYSPAGPHAVQGNPTTPLISCWSLQKLELGGRNGHSNDSQEIKILKEGGWRKGWVIEIACLLPLPEKQGGWGMLKWEHTSFFPCGY